MKLLIQLLQVVALLLVIALLGGLIYEGLRLQPTLETTARDLHVTVLEAGLTLKNIREATAEWKKASDAQIKQSSAVLTETTATLASVQNGVTHLDASLTTLVNRSSEAIDQQNQSLLQTQAKLRDNLDQMQKATEQLQASIASANLVLANPSIPRSLGNIDRATAQMADSMTNLTAATNNVKVVADAFKNDFVRPKNRAWAYIKALLGLGSQGRILFGNR